MPQRQPNRRVGVLSQRLSDEESPCTGTSAELLSRFLSSVDFTCPKPPRAWESNPLYKELKRTLQGTIHMQQVEELLREKYRTASIMTSFASGQSTLTTISSSQSNSLQDTEPHASSSTLDSDDRLWWAKQTTSHRSQEQDSFGDSQTCATQKPSPTPELSISEEARSSERAGSSLKAKVGLEGLQGMWKLKWDEPVRLLDLCRLMELDKDEMERREENTLLEIKLMGHLFCVKSEIFGLYNVEVPLNGEISRIPRMDHHNSVMSAHIETSRRGLRMIYTWDHPSAATRRDNYELSPDGDKLILTAYLMQRDGHYCKVKWQFERHAENA